MKRDMELIRRILLAMESNDTAADFSAFPPEEFVYHKALLIEAGFVDGTIRKDHRGIPNGVNLVKITWAGHEFLDAARNETVWKKISKKLKEEGISIGVELLKTALVEAGKDQLRAAGILHDK